MSNQIDDNNEVSIIQMNKIIDNYNYRNSRNKKQYINKIYKEQICCLCMDKETSILFNCGHHIVCNECNNNLYENINTMKCPMCKNDIIIVFDTKLGIGTETEISLQQDISIFEFIYYNRIFRLIISNIRISILIVYLLSYLYNYILMFFLFFIYLIHIKLIFS
jgi:hypothetical protein